MSKPLASVLMPVYNERPKYLYAAVDSVLRQTFRNFELLLIDDGSDDESTVAALRECANKDSRVVLIRLPHVGIVKGPNHGIAASRGELLFRHDADDWSEHDRFERQIRFLASNPDVAVVGCHSRMYQDNGRPLWVPKLPTESATIASALRFGNVFFHGSVCMRKAAVEAVGGYREPLTYTEDYDLFCRLSERYGAANLRDVLYHHRRRSSSTSVRNLSQQELSRRIAKHLSSMRQSGLPEDFDEARRRAAADLATTHATMLELKAGDCSMLAGAYSDAAAKYLSVLRRHPLRITAILKAIRLMLFAACPSAGGWLFGYTARPAGCVARSGVASRIH